MVKNIHIVKEKYFLLLTAVFIVLLVIFFNHFEIVLPIGIGVLTVYYFISLNSTCPKCDKPFSKKIVGKKLIEHHSEFSESDMDKVDCTHNITRFEYECKHCKHRWIEEKEKDYR